MTLPVVSISGKKKKKPSLVLTLSGAGLLIGGGIAAYWLFTQGKPLSRDLPVGANIIPQDALFTVSLSTDSSQWEKLRSFGTKESQAALDQNLIQWRDRFLAKEGFDFKKDVSPWVGDQVTIAILAPKAPVTASKPVASDGKLATVEQSLVMVLPIKDQNKIQTALAQPKALKGKWVDREYEGITIKEAQTNSGEKLSTAVIEERFLVIADNPKATERTIKAYKGKATLAASKGFAKHLPKIATYQPLAQFYVNVPSAAQIASTTSAKRRLPAQVLAQLKNNKGLAGTVSLEPQGLRIKGVSWLKPSSRRVLAVENKANTMTTRLPESTLMMFSGGNLRRLWADYVLTSQKNPLSPVKPEKLRKGFKNLSGLDLDRDLLSWMGGEFAVSVVPQTPNTEFPQDVRAALVFMVQASDRRKAEASMKQLDDAMRNQYQFKIKEDKVGQVPVTRWIGPSGTLTATHGWLEEDIAFLTLGTPISDKIIPKPKNILAKAGLFQKAVPSELNPISTQFFLDMEGAAKNFSLPALFPNQQSFLNAINSVGVTSAVSDSRTTRYDILLKLKEGDRPVELPNAEEKSE
ncbi:Protein of unknown function (DUF3352) [Rivularia sp. PCC 7116]|uniref:DUF3352 domain-containing protein n=1 Tax=Rivularia sp. PCC 7116 TaxID=373994 RepID=UPI00029F2F81|nr:DUF3352 domain-containing protein [Rivularia sp. PCC 7116]AFY53254.1 Protein of unknown function (DUF3352) [Rivularia sp. PCC 7116]